MPRKTRHKQFKLNKQTWLIGLRLLPARWRGRYALTLSTPKYLHPIFLYKWIQGRWMDGWIRIWRGWLERIDK